MLKNKRDLLRFIGILVIILVLLLGLYTFYGGLIGSILYNTFLYGKYSSMFIFELVVILFSFIIITLRKLWPQIIKRKESFLVGIKRGMPILVIAIIMLLVNGGEIIVNNHLNIPNFISLVLVSVAIGIAEEFIFRGWLQNELMNRYGSTFKKTVITIVVSGFLFGLFHMINVLSGQDILTTLSQVIQSSAIGILFCSVYYASKNIWSLVFLHSFYDFSVLLSEVNSYKDCINNTDVSLIANIITLVISIIFSVIYIAYSYLNIKNNSEIKRRITQIIIVAIVALFITTYISPTDELMARQVCFEFTEIEINEGKKTFFIEDEFLINYIDQNNYAYNYKLFIQNGKLNITNLKTGDSNLFDIDNVYSFIVYEDNLNYVILINSLDKVYLSNYMSINNLSDDKNYLEDIKNSFISFDTPSILEIGYLENNQGIYPLLKSEISDYFIIKDNKVMVVK